jgi:hypothetical protein
MHVFGLNSTWDNCDTHTNKCWQLDLVNKNYKLSYINIIYREIMVRLMHKKYKFLMMKYSVLLFINLAFFSFFTKIVSTLYTGLYISFLFSHINITLSKKWYHYHKWKINKRKNTKTKHKPQNTKQKTR